MSSRQNPLYTCDQLLLSWLSLFGGALSLSRVLWESAYSRSNMKPKPIPKQARTWIEALFCWFQVLRQHFMFLSFCMRFLLFCFHYPLICFHFTSFSFHISPMCIHVNSSSFHLQNKMHAIFVHVVVFMSFHFLSKVSLWLGQRAECNK